MSTSMKSLLTLVSTLAWVACSPPPPGPGANPDGGQLPDGGNITQPGAPSASLPGATTTEPFPQTQACQVIDNTVQPTTRPADIVIAIDNSGSMTLEITSVENNINTNFASIIGASGLDYRVILVSKHGTASSDQSVCIKSPLSGTSCSPVPAQPVQSTRFFHYSTEISSTNSLSELIRTYDVSDANNALPGGWKNALRAGSFKTFLEITDDKTDLTADQFEAQLFAKSATNFGSASNRLYVFHSIIGIIENTPTSAAWQPADAIKNSKCASAAAPGPQYEELSKRTGGLRFPICQTSSYDAVFQAMANGVIAASTLSCQFKPPAPPTGQEYDRYYVKYEPSNGDAALYLQSAPNVGECSAGKFYMIGNDLVLCPASCDVLKADSGAKVKVVYSCGPTIG
jgi:hypothetical protein